MPSHGAFIISLVVVGVSCGVAPPDTGVDVVVATVAPLATLAPPIALPVATVAPPVTPTAADPPVTPTAADPAGDNVVTDGQSSSTAAPTFLSSYQAFQQSPNTKAFNLVHIVLMLIFACVYKSKVVDAYPELKEPNERSTELQNENEVSACFNSCFTPNCLLAYFCYAPRSAHTLDKVGIISYWPATCLMICCPFCTMCYTNACTDLNERLGGEKRNCCMSMICAWFCLTCVIQQDAASLDAATNSDTQCLSVEEGDAGSGSE